MVGCKGGRKDNFCSGKVQASSIQRWKMFHQRMGVVSLPSILHTFWVDCPITRGRFFLPSNPSLHVVRGREREIVPRTQFCLPDSSSIISRFCAPHLFVTGRGREEGKGGGREKKEGEKERRIAAVRRGTPT